MFAWRNIFCQKNGTKISQLLYFLVKKALGVGHMSAIFHRLKSLIQVLLHLFNDYSSHCDGRYLVNASCGTKNVPAMLNRCQHNANIGSMFPACWGFDQLNINNKLCYYLGSHLEIIIKHSCFWHPRSAQNLMQRETHGEFPSQSVAQSICDNGTLLGVRQAYISDAGSALTQHWADRLVLTGSTSLHYNIYTFSPLS